jgi:hypothetical protein
VCTALCETPSRRNYIHADKKGNLCMNIEVMEAVAKNVRCMGGSEAVDALIIASNVY